MLRGSFQTKLFFAAFATTLLALVVAGLLFALTMQRDTNARVERTLRADAQLAAYLLARPSPGEADDQVRALDMEADEIGARLAARVTFIASDGAVLGDSAESFEAIATMENHATRPEIVDARASGVGTSRRASATLNEEMLYVAVRVTHPRVAFIRVALPLTTVRSQLSAVLGSTITALGLALLGGAVAAAVLAGRIGQRVRAIAWIAQRYREGDLTPPHLEYGDDELGVVARALDDSVHELGRRLEDLQRGQSRMAAILAGMIEGVIVVDQNGRLQLVNNAACEMLKIDEPPIGRHYMESIRHPTIADLVTTALRGRTPSSVEFTPPRDNGRTIIARAAPVGSGTLHGLVLVLHDITELRRADTIRRDFVANVSHELRTPLTAIRGYVEALSDGDTGPDDSRVFLDVIMRHTRRMERLVQDLLRLARLEAGQETLDLASCDLQSVIQAVVADLEPSTDAKQQHVEIALAPETSAVIADAAKLHDALRNLVANASAYAPDQTTIRIASRRVADTICIDVLDEGPGVPEQDHSRVFERFYRVDKSRARDPGGTGLGLAIVKHLVEAHGGRVSVSNRAEGGACFTVELKAGPTD